MNYRETIRDELKYQESVLIYALKIADFFSDHDPKHHNKLSMSDLLSSIPDGRNDLNSFVTALLYLSHSKTPLFEMEYQYFDEDSEQYLEVDPQNIYAAEQSGIFYHPDSGISVNDYKEKIIVFYIPTKIANELHET